MGKSKKKVQKTSKKYLKKNTKPLIFKGFFYLFYLTLLSEHGTLYICNSEKGINMFDDLIR